MATRRQTLIKVIDAASSEERRWALWYLTLAVVQATVRRMSGDDAAARGGYSNFLDANAEDATLTALAASLGEDRA